MENQPQTYQRLGMLTFWIFVLENIALSLIPLFLFLITLALKAINVPNTVGDLMNAPDASAAIDNVLNWSILGTLLFFICGTLIAFSLALIDYYTYSFVLDDHALHIKRGLINTEEVSIPYRQIQNIDIERPLIYQILGASRLVILTAGHDDQNEDDFKDDSEGTIPAIPKKFAEELRATLIQKANVQEVVEVKK